LGAVFPGNPWASSSHAQIRRGLSLSGSPKLSSSPQRESSASPVRGTGQLHGSAGAPTYSQFAGSPVKPSALSVRGAGLRRNSYECQQHDHGADGSSPVPASVSSSSRRSSSAGPKPRPNSGLKTYRLRKRKDSDKTPSAALLPASLPPDSLLLSLRQQSEHDAREVDLPSAVNSESPVNEKPVSLFC